MLLVVCQLSRDVIGYEDSKYHWCFSICLLSQFSSFRFTFSCLIGQSTTAAWSFYMGYSQAGVTLERILLIQVPDLSTNDEK